MQRQKERGFLLFLNLESLAKCSFHLHSLCVSVPLLTRVLLRVLDYFVVRKFRSSKSSGISPTLCMAVDV